ncbi:hypothetical protein PCURB6_42370 [Paenibacillus curdlanolyticus]|nr:hypothetical protein PCURB6_42370 [Paenibacillus curdlanolyticus]
MKDISETHYIRKETGDRVFLKVVPPQKTYKAGVYMNCTNCGTEFQDDDIYCRKCGLQVVHDTNLYSKRSPCTLLC